MDLASPSNRAARSRSSSLRDEDAVRRLLDQGADGFVCALELPASAAGFLVRSFGRVERPRQSPGRDARYWPAGLMKQCAGGKKNQSAAMAEIALAPTLPRNPPSQELRKTAG